MERERSVSYFKAILVIGMVLSHAFALLATGRSVPLALASSYVNLVTFPGFVFAFGYVYERAYLARQVSRQRILRSALKLLFAFVLSGMLFRALVSGGPLTARGVVSILLLSDVPGYSEFLASFFALALVFGLWPSAFDWLLRRPVALGLTAAACLACTFVPYELIAANQLGVLIGTTRTPCFPVVQYLPWFFAGLAISRYRIGWSPWLLTACAGCTAAFVAFSVATRTLPLRFPPSLLWIIGPALFVYVYYLSSRVLASRVYSRTLDGIGENTLYYLVASNAILFALAGRIKVTAPESVALGLAVLIGIHFLLSTTRPTESPRVARA
jgi:hypothetical protein